MNNFTLADVYAAAAPHLPLALVGADYQDHILQIARQLPLTRTAGFECRLTETDPRADFLAAFNLEDTQQAIAMHPETRLFNASDALHHFIQTWMQPDSLLHKTVINSWFEFDITAPPTPPLLPGILFCNLQADPQREVVIRHSLEILLGAKCSPEFQRQIDQYFAALPVETYVFAFGVMVARPMEGARLCTHHPTIAAAWDFLKALGWDFDLSEVVRLIAPIQDQLKYVRLSVDISSGGLFPRVGFDLHMDEVKRPRITPEWEAVLAYLVDRGLCQPAKRDALLTWFGRSYLDLNRPGLVFRALNHLKIAYLPGAPLEVKAYFGFTYIRMNAIVTFQRPEG